jgi:cytochrome P450
MNARAEPESKSIMATTKPLRHFSFSLPEGLDPQPELAELRRDEPVARVLLPSGDIAWMITRYDDVRTVLADQRFSRAAAATFGGPRITAGRPSLPSSILAADPPAHTRLRKLVAPAFTARRSKQLSPYIEGLVVDLLEAMEHVGAPADLVTYLTQPLPLAVICELMGIPDTGGEPFHAWADAMKSVTAQPAEATAAALADMTAYLSELVAVKRVDLTDDLLGTLITARDQQERLSEEELVSFCLVLLLGGYQTTAERLAGMIYTLLCHPDQLDLLRAYPDRVSAAVEELLRFPQFTATGLFRVVTEDLELGGVVLRAGEAVMPIVASANRDESIFANADQLDVFRTDNPHLTFGHGVHHCLGAQLARIELTEALGALLRRFPGLRLAGPEHPTLWKTGLTVRAPRSLPVCW